MPAHKFRCRTNDPGGDFRSAVQIEDLLVFLGLNTPVFCVKRSRALAASNVWHTTTGKHLAEQFFRWESDRTAQDDAGNSRFREILPQRNTLPLVDGTRRCQDVLGSLETAEGDVREVGLWVAK